MTDFEMGKLKDLGLQREVFDALPYAVVGGAWEGSFEVAIAYGDSWSVLSHIVPKGQQLKLLFLRVWTQYSGGAKFSIVQTNPSAVGQTGAVEAYPVVGSVPPFTAGQTAVRDYPMLEANGAEVLHGSLKDPIHVLEGSIDFNIIGAVPVSVGDRYGIVWSGVEKIPE